MFGGAVVDGLAADAADCFRWLHDAVQDRLGAARLKTQATRNDLARWRGKTTNPAATNRTGSQLGTADLATFRWPPIVHRAAKAKAAAS